MWKNKLKEIIYILEHSEINEIEANFWGRKYRVVKNSPMINSALGSGQSVIPQGIDSDITAKTMNSIESESADSLSEVKSPMPGTFYCSPNPKAAAFVKVGDRVTKGESLCIVEAMKIMNEIESSVDGVVKEVLVENGKPVEYNQPLFRIE
ncbi:MAG: acetyl-CoA carboxylase biotin carboxyl carrier protein [Candidatus Marinimicrobia bacterium]|nr:acetyl-CoA carboxylase biotin carboxyl carrier protein [Candidatus Neomarinimicrobiota bacterium]